MRDRSSFITFLIFREALPPRSFRISFAWLWGSATFLGLLLFLGLLGSLGGFWWGRYASPLESVSKLQTSHVEKKKTLSNPLSPPWGVHGLSFPKKETTATLHHIQFTSGPPWALQWEVRPAESQSLGELQAIVFVTSGEGLFVFPPEALVNESGSELFSLSEGKKIPESGQVRFEFDLPQAVRLLEAQPLPKANLWIWVYRPTDHSLVASLQLPSTEWVKRASGAAP